ncbi:hypothetical protein QLQ12_20650 [Actinoplanes sp. NEAU-A12]|uniref:Uncharacterized protein n=1 Tax=Actinoplanes sandaracinus TaxID=3045177 RepID=A0ABT6WMQ8_9ACTN|nr:hypothetical protein [Actinoplanes sandaracinus]MDI6101027.1 hypothetical protein [Actinoplanes sandaracinus]
MASGASGWFRRRTPRLSGTLHIRDATGRELVVPLRGRASLLTAGGTGLRGYGEVWAVRTGTPTAQTGTPADRADTPGGAGTADRADTPGRADTADLADTPNGVGTPGGAGTADRAGTPVDTGASAESADTSPDQTRLMIVYGPAESAGDRHSGLCAAGQTVTLGGVDFTWRAVPTPAVRVPRPRSAAPNVPRNLRIPVARSTNTRAEPVRAGGLRGRIRNMVRIVTQVNRSPE